MPSTLVLGAGELGTPVLHSLATHPSRDTPITVLLRPQTFTHPSPAKQAEIASLKALGISILAADILTSTEDELRDIFSQFHTIVGCTGMTYPAGTQLKLARAVLAAKVPRYFPWQFGVDYDVIGRFSSQDLFTEQIAVRDLLRAQERTDWVVVSTGMFMSFLFEETFGVVRNDLRAVRALGGGENRVSVTAPRDIGRVVAELVWEGKDVKGVVFVAGQIISYTQLAEVLEGALGHEVRVEDWGVEMLKEELADDPGNGIKKYRVVFAEGRGVAWDEAETFNVKKGLKLQDVRGWVEENMGRPK